MREIVTREQVDAFFLALALAAPVIGALAGGLLGIARRRAGSLALRGLAFGLGGPLLLLLWRVYNGITERLGLDSVANLLVNLALFISLGVVGGALIGLGSRRAQKEPREPAEKAAPPDRDSEPGLSHRESDGYAREP